MKQIMRISIRRLGETLYIGDDVQVTIFAIKGDEVRLGIEAPKSVPIRRGELTIKEALRQSPPMVFGRRERR